MRLWAARLTVTAVLLLTAAAAAADVRTVAVQKSSELKSLRERSNRNDHPMIDRMLAYCGVPPRNSWCMAFVVWNYGQAAEVLRIKKPMYRSARCSTVWWHAMDNPLRYHIIKPEDVLAGRTIPVGAVTIWRSGAAAKNRNWNGHTGLVLQQLGRKQFLCREGNTQPGPGGNQREGGGVYDRTRGYGLGTTFEVQGWIVPR